MWHAQGVFSPQFFPFHIRQHWLRPVESQNIDFGGSSRLLINEIWLESVKTLGSSVLNRFTQYVWWKSRVFEKTTIPSEV